jgi:hypothetical protein
MANREKKIIPGDSGQKLEADVSSFNELKLLAYSIIVGILFWMLNREYFVKVYQNFPDKWKSSSPIEAGIFIAPIILFILLIILLIRWIFATWEGFDLWKRWLIHPMTEWQKRAAFFALAIMLGILPAFPNHIVLTSGLLMIYSFMNYWTQWLTNDHFHRALQKTRSLTVGKVQNEVLKAMENFWLKRPQLGRIIIVTFFNFVAFGFALAGEMQQEPQKSYFQLSAYAVLILVLFVSEVVIAWWRYKLDQSIKQIIEAAEKHAHGVK